MKQHIGISAGLLMLGLGAIGSAAAQSAYPPAPGFANPGLPSSEIMRTVSSHGLTPVTRPVRRGRFYVLLATDKSNQEMRVTVDARLGDIVDLRPPIAEEPLGPQIGALPPTIAPTLPATVGAAPAAGLSSPYRPPPVADFAPRPFAPSAPVPHVGSAAPVAAYPGTTHAPATAAPAPSLSATAQPNLPPLPPPPPLPLPRPNATTAAAPGETPAAPRFRKFPGVPPAVPDTKNSVGEIE